jgi:hypothetical protein
MFSLLFGGLEGMRVRKEASRKKQKERKRFQKILPPFFFSLTRNVPCSRGLGDQDIL